MKHINVLMHKDVPRGTVQPIIALGFDKELRTDEVEKEIADAICESGVMGQYALIGGCAEIANIVTHMENAEFTLFDIHKFWIATVPFI